MAAHTCQPIATSSSGLAPNEGIAAVWALFEVLDELPGSADVQASVIVTRQRLAAELRQLQLREEDLRHHAGGLAARWGWPPAVDRPPDPQSS